jgi:hypothetical protein
MKSMVLKFDDSDPYSLRRKYRSPNPLMSLIKFYNPTSIPNTVIGERFSSLYDINSRRLSSDERKEVYRYVKYSRDTEVSIFNYCSYKKCLFRNGHFQYIKPECIRGASESLWGSRGIPIIETYKEKPRFNVQEVELKLQLLDKKYGALIERILTIRPNFEISEENLKKIASELIDIGREKRNTSFDPIENIEPVPKPKVRYEFANYWDWDVDNDYDHSPFSSDPFVQIFKRIDDYLSVIRSNEMFRSMAADRGGDADREVPDFDPHMQRCWLESGGKLDDNKLPIIRGGDFFDNDSGSESGGLGGLFED